MILSFFIVVAIVGPFIGLALYYRVPSEERFVKKNYEKLTHYQKKVKSFSTVVNDKYSELDYKLQCAMDTVTCYEELRSFCFQSTDGRKWYQSTCEQPESAAREAVADFEEQIAILEERKTTLAKDFQKGDWRIYWSDETHNLQGQGSRITRSYEEPIQIEAYNPAARLALIRGASRNRYLTTLGFCTCPDFKKRELPCKHIYCLCRLTAAPEFSAPIKIPKMGLYGVKACVTGKFNFGTQEAVRMLLARYLASVSLSIEPADFILEGQKVTTRALQRATRLGLMQINEDELLPMLDTEQNIQR